jgi:DNA-binding transcriptional LysR family regulator
MVDFAKAGVHQAEIARLVGVCSRTVRERLEAAGVRPPGPLSTSPGVEAAVSMVKSGVAIAEAAAKHCVSYQAVAKCLAKRGIKSRPRRRQPDGRTMRAVERVLAGATIAEASRAERCSPSSVSVYVKRIRENTETQLA